MEWDEASHFPIEIMPKLGEMGLLGRDFFRNSMAARGWVTSNTRWRLKNLAARGWLRGLIVAAHNSLCSNHIYKFGTEAQKKKYLAQLASGKAIGAWSLTEPEAGSDAGGTRTTAVRDGKHWVLNGAKTLRPTGSTRIIAWLWRLRISRKARTDQRVHPGKGMKGFRPGKKENKLGMRASDTSEVIFSDCRVPEDNYSGRRARGLPQLEDSGWRTDFDSGAGAGMAQGALEGSHEIRETTETVWSGD